MLPVNSTQKNPLLVRAHGSELLGHFVVPAPLIMQPSEEAKRAIPIHEFYSHFVFWNNFYQFRKNITINRPFLSSVSFLFVTDLFFVHFFMHLSQIGTCVHRSQNAPDAQTPAGLAGRS